MGVEAEVGVTSVFLSHYVEWEKMTKKRILMKKTCHIKEEKYLEETPQKSNQRDRDKKRVV